MMDLNASTLESLTIPTQIFKCPVCYDTPAIKAKIYQCKNGHLICEQCYTKLSQRRFCPTCRENVEEEPIRNRKVEEALEFVETFCPFRDRGCSEILLRLNLSTHLEECPFGPVHLCSLLGFPDCQFDGNNPNGLVDHLTRVHKLIHKSCKIREHSYDIKLSDKDSSISLLNGPLAFIKTVEDFHYRSQFSESRPSFVILAKEDERSEGLYFLCLFIGRNEESSRRFSASFYITGSEVPMCSMVWPTIWYKKVAWYKEKAWKHATHMSRRMLRGIQGEDAAINISIRIKECEIDPIREVFRTEL